MTPTIRAARPEELENLLAMQFRSLRVFGAAFHERDVLEAALAQIGTMDPRLIGDGTLLVAELAGRLAGSAGWTTRTPLYARLLPATLPALPVPSARVRSLFVDPDVAGLGVGRCLMAAVEAQIREAGLGAAELLAPASAEPFCARLGYMALSDHALELAEGMVLPVRRMARQLEPALVAA